MKLRDPIIKHHDVTGTLLHFSREQIESLMESMPPEQRRFAHVLAETIKQPHEIWQTWVADESSKGNWLKERSYLQYLKLAKTDSRGSFGVAIVQFTYRSRWELANVGLVLGTQESVMDQVDQTIRTGSIEYSNIMH